MPSISLKRGTEAALIATNPVLANGEPGYDTTNNILKIGDGSTAWNNLNNHNHTSSNISDFTNAVNNTIIHPFLLGGM